MVMFEIWSLGHKPFEKYTNAEVHIQVSLFDGLISLVPISSVSMQAIKMNDQRFRLPPPPGCPRAIYHLMIQCW